MKSIDEDSSSVFRTTAAGQGLYQFLVDHKTVTVYSESAEQAHSIVMRFAQWQGRTTPDIRNVSFRPL